MLMKQPVLDSAKQAQAANRYKRRMGRLLPRSCESVSTDSIGCDDRALEEISPEFGDFSEESAWTE
jgi:hypothetical protein